MPHAKGWSRVLDALSVRSIAFLFVAGMGLTISWGQVQPEEIGRLKGTEAPAAITIGVDALLPQLSSAYPVNTLVYPDGQVVFRVEFGFIRGEASQLQKRFDTDTPLQITSVDLKEDRLELKVVGRNRESGRLKFILGSQWQKKMSIVDVLRVIRLALTLPADLPAASSAGADRTTPARAVTLPDTRSHYQRPDPPFVSVERVDQTQVQSILDSLYSKEEALQTQVLKESTSVARAFRVFESTQYNQPNLRPIREIAELRATLGAALVPRNPDDAELIRRAYADCVQFAALNITRDATGRPLGAASRNPEYQRLFDRGDVEMAQRQATQKLIGAVSDLQLDRDLQHAILALESQLDQGYLSSAAESLAALDNARDPHPQELALYLTLSGPLRKDLQATLELRHTATTTSGPLVEAIQQLAVKHQKDLGLVCGPLSSEVETRSWEDEKAALGARLNRLKPFHYDATAYNTSPKAPPQLLRQALEQSYLNLTDALNQASELSDLEKSQNSLDRIQQWFGDDYAKRLVRFGSGLPSAEAKQAELASLIHKIQDRDNQRGALANEVVNSGLLVMKLREKFLETQILGYQMEEVKQRQLLTKLIATHNGELDRAFWQEVEVYLASLERGLTVTEATYIRNLISQLRH